MKTADQLLAHVHVTDALVEVGNIRALALLMADNESSQDALLAAIVTMSDQASESLCDAAGILEVVEGGAA